MESDHDNLLIKLNKLLKKTEEETDMVIAVNQLIDGASTIRDNYLPGENTDRREYLRGQNANKRKLKRQQQLERLAIEIEIGLLKIESRVKNIEKTNRVLLNRIRKSANMFKDKEWVKPCFKPSPKISKDSLDIPNEIVKIKEE